MQVLQSWHVAVFDFSAPLICVILLCCCCFLALLLLTMAAFIQGAMIAVFSLGLAFVLANHKENDLANQIKTICKTETPKIKNMTDTPFAS